MLLESKRQRLRGPFVGLGPRASGGSALEYVDLRKPTFGETASDCIWRIFAGRGGSAGGAIADDWNGGAGWRAGNQLVCRRSSASFGNMPENAARVEDIGHAQAPRLHRGCSWRLHAE
jgi:hypothetical protein